MSPSSLLVLFPLLALGTAQSLSAQLPPVPTPPGNPTTPDKAALGKVLFWDEHMTSTRTMSCGTCHNPDAGGHDPRSAFAIHPGPDMQFGTDDDIHGSAGSVRTQANGTYTPYAPYGLTIQVTGRASQSMINAAYNTEQFWDGRVDDVFKDPLTGAVVLPRLASLEHQASKPPLSLTHSSSPGRTWQDIANDMAAADPLSLAPSVPAALDAWIAGRSYPALFDQVYGDPSVTPARIIMAIAAYERTLISDQTPFDLGTLTPMQQWGLEIFNNKGRCTLCHEGPLFRDDAYHNIGVRPSFEDPGRFNVTGLPDDMGRFKTPGLRNVGLRTVFMHNGGFQSLAEVIEFYDRGGDFFDNLDPAMQPLGLTVFEKVALLDFLQNGLTDWRVAAKAPPFDRPSLYAEGNRVPQHYGQGTAGSGGFVPRLIALEPPVLGNPNLTLAFADGVGNSIAMLAFDTSPGTGLPVLGVPILVGGSSALTIMPLGLLSGTGPGQGSWSGTLAVPSNPALTGTSVYMQGLAIDPGGPQGFTGTPGVQMTLFAPR